MYTPMLTNNKHLMPTFLIICTLLSGCSTLDLLQSKLSPLTPNPKKTVQESKVANAWNAALPHGGSLENLSNFWGQYEDPLLLELIASAQQVSATIATANTRIADARTKRITTRASVLPTLDANVSATRSQQAGGQSGFNVGTTDSYLASVQAAWEIDILGANKVLMAAAERREQASKSAWHDARVSVAAEVATSYFNQRFCEMQTALYAADAKSKSETVRLTEIAFKAGFSAQGTLTLAQASMADAKQQLKSQQAQCDVSLKELVALTGWEEALLRQKLMQSPFKLNNQAHFFSILEVPASVIAQRPDIDQAESELVLAMADVKSAQVARLPRVSLSGSIGWQRFTSAGFTSNGETWSIGPLTITLPLFDGGKRKANQALAEVKYEEQAMLYRSKLRTAIQEIETALINLQSTQLRAADLEAAIYQYQQALVATEHRYKAGFANLIEVEESRRYALQAELNQVSLRQARNNAWINLYRAVGGGWQPNDTLSMTVNQEKQ